MEFNKNMTEAISSYSQLLVHRAFLVEKCLPKYSALEQFDGTSYVHLSVLIAGAHVDLCGHRSSMRTERASSYQWYLDYGRRITFQGSSSQQCRKCGKRIKPYWVWQ